MYRSIIVFTIGFLLLVTVGCEDNPIDAAEHLESAALQTATGDQANQVKETLPFEDTEVFFERNFTDDDLGLQVFLDGTGPDDEGWTKVDVTDPANHKIFQVLTQGSLSDLGITELRFESAEPSPAEVLALFPEGEYEFRGKTVESVRLVGSARLSHSFIQPPFNLSPVSGATVDPNNATITWDVTNAGAEFEQVELIIENDETGLIVLDVFADQASGSLDIPPILLKPDTDYKVEILVYNMFGNASIEENEFETL